MSDHGPYSDFKCWQNHFAGSPIRVGQLVLRLCVFKLGLLQKRLATYVRVVGDLVDAADFPAIPVASRFGRESMLRLDPDRRETLMYALACCNDLGTTEKC